VAEQPRSRLTSLLKRRAPGLWGNLCRRWNRLAPNLAPVALAGEFLASGASGFRNRTAFSQVDHFVLFVGYGRSGHSLVGSLLNAHPDIVVSHQLNALRLVQAGFRRQQLFASILRSDQAFGRKGRVANRGRYDYRVPDQWQGRFRTLRVIGDKRGSSSTKLLGNQPELRARLADVVGVPVKLVHVVRNPFDNISTMSLRSRTSLSNAMRLYFRQCKVVDGLRAVTDAEDWLDVRSEDLIADPAACISRLCSFLGVAPEGGYLQDCASIIHERPHQSRQEVAWSPEQIAEVQARIDQHEFLRGYAYHEPLPLP
jgi:hypothetical protein